jgi:membrane protease YdiL (CAAX protease family)
MPAMPAPSMPGRVRRWLRHPLILLPVKSLVVIAAMLLIDRSLGQQHWPRTMEVLLLDPITIVTVIAAFVLCTRVMEARAVSELAPNKALTETLAGFALGTLAFAGVIGVLAALGLYRITGRDDWSILAVPLAGAFVTGVFEEILCRGIWFRVVQDSLGSYWALAISAAFFGCAHLLNPHATWFAAIAIMIEAGIFLSAAYMLTRRLWLPIGIHAGWNFTQGGVFGVAVSGTHSEGMLHATLTGPVWLSGGEFGAESSVVAVVICGTMGIALFAYARRLHHVVAPHWRRGPASAAAAAAAAAE